ncbi:MAG: hypothetical protein JWM78_1843 [Verrucomicrobiaceae bacterium]|nr:hypothetical protein [Verrucomicrobiaceae bacterium]
MAVLPLLVEIAATLVDIPQLLGEEEHSVAKKNVVRRGKIQCGEEERGVVRLGVVLGGGLQLIGSAVLFLDLRGDRIAQKATEIQIYIGRLDEQIEDIEKEPKERGMKTREGIDIGEAFDIMEQAAKLANRENKKKHLNLLEEVLAETAKHHRAQTAAIVLVLLGSVLQIISALL